MSNYKPRLTSPAGNNKYWRHTSVGGLNECIYITNGSVLPNCVGYAWGRFYEISGKRPKLSKSNAENWYGYNDGYKRGNTPRLGAVACWSKGKVGVGSDGAGHVAIVEVINDDGSIVISQSGYGASRFWTSKLTKGYAMSGYTFQGFIYNPAVADKVTAPKYVKGGEYTLVEPVKVRGGAGTKYSVKQVKDLTADGRKNATSTKGTDIAVLKKGTVVTAKAVITDGNDIWLKIPSGYVCAKKGNEVYII